MTLTLLPDNHHRVVTPRRAVIYIRSGPDLIRHERLCLDHCADAGWTVAGLVIDHTRTGTLLGDAYRMVAAGEADVILVADPTHLRAVVASPTSGPAPSQRRARPTTPRPPPEIDGGR